jgi:hypothetical protein
MQLNGQIGDCRNGKYSAPPPETSADPKTLGTQAEDSDPLLALALSTWLLSTRSLALLFIVSFFVMFITGALPGSK